MACWLNAYSFVLWGSGEEYPGSYPKSTTYMEMAPRKSIDHPEANFIMCKMDLLIAYTRHRTVGKNK